MRYFLDTEFIESGSNEPIHLISIGIISEDNREFYAELNGVDYFKANDWVKENVIPHLWSRQQNKTEYNKWFRDGGKGGLLWRGELARELIEFIGDDPKPEFWGYYADYDWVVFCQIFGTMMDLPRQWICPKHPDSGRKFPPITLTKDISYCMECKGNTEVEQVQWFPMYCNDLKQLAVMLGASQLPGQLETEHHALNDARWNKKAFEFLEEYAKNHNYYLPRVFG